MSLIKRDLIRIVSLSFVAFLAYGVGAQDDLMTVHDVAMTKSVTSAEISPDGNHVVYTLSVPRDPLQDESGSAYSNMYVVDHEGNSRPFITGKTSVSQVQWSPDGKVISFLSRRGDDQSTSLYAIPFDGGEARKLAELETSIGGYTWRPDSLQVALLATDKADAQDEKLAKKGFNPEFYEEQLQFTRIWTVDADPDTDDEPHLLKIDGNCSEISYSPDGSKLVVAIAEKPLIDYFYMFRKLHVVDASSGAMVAKIDNPGKLGPVSWSPDGSTIAFCSGEDINDPSEGRLMTVSSSGGIPVEVMKDYLPNITGIAWKDNDTILFTTEDGCLAGFGEVGKDGSNRRMLIKPGGPIISGFSVSDDRSRAALQANSPKFPDEVFLFDMSSTPDRLTESNPWLSEKRLAKQEIVRYQAKDGETIEGVLVRPLDEEPGRRYPLIVAVHGGPEASVANGWVTRYSYPGQVGAARGIATFYPNYRGSTGRGVPFAKAHQADYGGKEFDDIVDGVDYLIDSGLVDGNKVGITGGSYGGFATAWCCTKHSERFAAGVMFVGISNQISKSGTTDIPEEMFLVHARKRIWQDWEFFLERSPIYYVENCKTPLLILHGKEDTRVHPSQSMELYRNLKILGQSPVRLVFYPGEGHGNRKSGARFDYNLRMMRWMEHYLTGAGGEMPAYRLDYGLDD